MYKKQNWHYFLLDFCYFANLCLLLYLFFFQTSGILFVLCFGMANGPLSWAVPTWRNSMVFHSLDKVTSVFIHIGPPVVTYSIRWFQSTNYPEYTICPDNDCNLPFYYFAILPFIPYTIWQIMYYVKVNIVSSHKNRMTSAKWLLEGSDRGLIAKMSCMPPFGEKHKLFGFIFWQYIYTFLTLLPVYFLWYNQTYHLFFLIFITLISIWNGACFYFDVFSKRYVETLEKKEKKITELKNSIDRSSEKTEEQKN